MHRPASAILWIAVASVLLGGLYWGFHTWLDVPTEGLPRARMFRISISAFQPGVESPTFKANQGDVVFLLVQSDRVGELHVHGYEKQVALKPGGESTLSFTADKVGLFPVHLHTPDNSMRHLAMVQVQPR